MLRRNNSAVYLRKGQNGTRIWCPDMNTLSNRWRNTVNGYWSRDFLCRNTCSIDNNWESDIPQTGLIDFLGVFVIHLPSGNGLNQQVSAYTGMIAVADLLCITLS